MTLETVTVPKRNLDAGLSAYTISSETQDPSAFKFEHGRQPTPATTIGTVSVAGGTTASDGVAKTFTASISGTASGQTYLWSATGANSANAAFSSTSVSNPSITFTGAGTYAVRVVVTASGATDSPVTKNVSIVVS